MHNIHNADATGRLRRLPLLLSQAQVVISLAEDVEVELQIKCLIVSRGKSILRCASLTDL